MARGVVVKEAGTAAEEVVEEEEMVEGLVGMLVTVRGALAASWGLEAR